MLSAYNCYGATYKCRGMPTCTCQNKLRKLIHIRNLIGKTGPETATIADIFTYICTHGYDKIATWMIDSFEIARVADISSIFSAVCYVGDIAIAKILMARFSEIDVHIANDYAICMAIYNGHRELATWLYENHGPFLNDRISRIIAVTMK